MRRFLRLGLGTACALVLVGGMLSGGAAAAAAAGPTFTVMVLPGSLTAGKSGVVQGTFTNNGAAVSGVAFTFTFPFSVSVPAANGCASVLPKTVACLVGLVGPGKTASKAFEFAVPAASNLPALPDSITVTGVAGWLSPAPPKAGLLKVNGTATIYAAGSLMIPLETGFDQVAGASDCVGQGGSVNGTGTAQSGEGEGQTEGPIVTAGPNSSGLPCTPFVAGVVTPPEGNDQLVVKLPLGTTAQVALYFVDETLPWPNNNDGTYSGPVDAENAHQPLLENPSYPNPGTDVIVPWCVGGSIPALGSGYSSDACIVSVDSTADTDNDDDTGTIVLNVVGTAGDGAFHGG